MYIKDCSCISPQLSFKNELFEEGPRLIKGTKYFALEPDYMEFIPTSLLRRMGRVVRLGIGSGLPLLKKHPGLDGIIIGTANGGLEDCFKFLDQIIRYEEGTLTPTNFVQSTPNAIAGGLALSDRNNGYNSTHVNGGLSFESALMNAKLMLERYPHKEFLTGAADELSDYNYSINNKMGLCKPTEVASSDLVEQETPGTIYGEGAAMFVLTHSAENAMAKIVDMDQICFPEKEDLSDLLDRLLNRCGLERSDIDHLLLGYNGDNRMNHWYDDFLANFPDAAVLSFKNLTGDFTVASSFACWMGSHILSGKSIPEECVLRSSEKPLERILIYNHYREEQHSFILLEKTV